MSNNNEQNQKSGDNSNNIQNINTVNVYKYDVDANTVLTIVQDEFKKIIPQLNEENMLKFAEMAKEIAKARSDEMTSSLCSKIGLIKVEQDKINNLLKSLKSPSMQCSIFEAQKAYIKSGNKTQMAILNEMLISRGLAKDQSTTQLMYEQAISVMSKLNQRHIDIISLMYIVVCIQGDHIITIGEFKSFVCEYISVFLNILPIKESELNYLASIGLLKSLEMSNYPEISSLFANKYPQLFCKGFSKEEFHQNIGTDKYDLYLQPSTHNKDLFQLIKNITMLKVMHIIDDKKETNLLNLIKQKQMSYSQVNKIIVEHCPGMDKLIENWGNNNNKKHKICGYQIRNIATIIAHQNTILKTKQNIRNTFKFD